MHDMQPKRRKDNPMIYAEAAYFDNAHVQHIADYEEHRRLQRLRKNAQKCIERERRSGSRARRAA